MFRSTHSTESSRTKSTTAEAGNPKSGDHYTVGQRILAPIILGGVAFSLSACGPEASANQGPSPEPGVTAPVTPGEVPTNTPEPTTPATSASPESTVVPSAEEVVDPSEIPSDWVKHGNYEYLPADVKAVIDSLNQMDIATFRQQPEDQQVFFAGFVLENARPIIAKQIKDAGLDLKYTNDPQTPQEIEDNQQFILVTANSLGTVKISGGSAAAGFDALTAQKLMALVSTDPNKTSSADAIYDNLAALSQKPTIQNSVADNSCIVNADTVVRGEGSISFTCTSQTTGESFSADYSAVSYTTPDGSQRVAYVDR